MDRLVNTVRPYAWGSPTAIPELLGVAPTGEPQAEMWMGAHPGAPSRTERGPLNEVVDADPVRELGKPAVDKFGPRLPFLLKVLAAGAPLSLQVHPDLDQARAGFAAEEAAGIPVDAPHRTYKDANHKPELICALTPFEGLCGFRAPAAAADLIAELGVDSLKPYVDLLHAHPEEAALREVLTALLTADREEMAHTVAEAAAAAERLGGDHAPFANLAHHFPGDPGSHRRRWLLDQSRGPAGRGALPGRRRAARLLRRHGRRDPWPTADNVPCAFNRPSHPNHADGAAQS
ncbi:hypothetical protein SNARM312S_04446 [Streptomyces narbonensis]